MASQEPIGIGSRPDVEAAPTQIAAPAAAATPTARTDSATAPPLQSPFVVVAERAAVSEESIQHLWLGMDSEVEVRPRCQCGQSVWLLLR